jgi:hypothetical protein
MELAARLNKVCNNCLSISIDSDKINKAPRRHLYNHPDADYKLQHGAYSTLHTEQ